MNKPSDRGIYIHIPFCSSKCYYCDFYSRVSSSAKKEEYIEALVSQIKLSPKEGAIKSIYLGGGTPSLLPPFSMSRVFSALDGFDISDDAEITLECNPENITEDYIKAVSAFGVNRISLGVQSFLDSELKNCGRRHTAAEAENAVYAIKESGIENVSLDLILGLPGQTAETLSVSLEKCTDLRPSHISAYILKSGENTVFAKKHISDPDDDTAAGFYMQTAKALTAAGYEHYEISSYSLPGKKSRHNMLYWTGGEYYAFGAGAYGFLNGRRFYFTPNIDEYIASNGTLRMTVEGYIGEKEKKEEAIIFGLRTSDGVAVALLENNLSFISRLISGGYAELNDSRLCLTERGFLVSNEIITELLDGEYDTKKNENI